MNESVQSPDSCHLSQVHPMKEKESFAIPWFLKVLVAVSASFLFLQIDISEANVRRILLLNQPSSLSSEDSVAITRVTGNSPSTRQAMPAMSMDVPKVWVHLTLATMYDQTLMLHLAHHYISVLGVDPSQILVELHHIDIEAKSVVEETRRRLQEEFSLQHFQTWHGNYTSDKKWKVRNEHRKQVNVSSCDWVVVADSDEFPAIPGGNLGRFLKFVGSQGYDSVFGIFSDKVAVDGSLPNISDYPSLQEQFPLSCRVTKLVARAHPKKVVAFRGFHHENRAAHGLMNPKSTDMPPDSKEWEKHCGYPVMLRIDHYKWHHPVILKLQRRYEVYLEMDGKRQRESMRVLDHIEENDGKLGIKDLECKEIPETVFYEEIYTKGTSCGKSKSSRRCRI